MIKLLTLLLSMTLLSPLSAQQKKKGPKVPDYARAIKNIEYSKAMVSLLTFMSQKSTPVKLLSSCGSMVVAEKWQ